MKIDTIKIQPYIDEKLVSVQEHPALDLFIYNYTQKCQFAQKWDDITKMCRGLILDGTGNVIARPFDKFFNLGENGVDQLPAEKFVAYDKADGSLGIMYPTTSSVALATRGSFLSEQSQVGTDMLRKVLNTMPAGMFKPYDITYLFEIIYPENRIVIDYHGVSKLVFLGAREIESGRVLTPDWFPDMKSYFEMPSPIVDYKTPRENAEGVVLTFYPSDYMVKIKYEEYVRLHRLVTGVNARRIWDILRNDGNMDELFELVPEEFADWVSKTAKTLVNDYAMIDRSVREIATEVEEQSDVRKDQAIYLMKHYKDLSAPLFRILDGKPYDDLIWKMLKPSHETSFKEEVQ